jgi:hypothetical protein
MISNTGQTVFAFDEKGGINLADGQSRLPRLAVVRFDKKGKILVRFRGNDVIVEPAELIKLVVGDDSQEVELAGPDGTKFVLPGVKANR